MGQIGTIRVDTQNNGTVSVPVFDTGDSGSSIYEFVRVQTGSGTGFIPVEDTSNATYPYLRVQSQSHGTVAMTDRNSATPDGIVDDFEDSDLSEYPFNQGNDWSVVDGGLIDGSNHHIQRTGTSSGQSGPQIHSVPGDGLPRYPVKGNTIEYYFQDKTGSQAEFRFGILNSNEENPGGYELEHGNKNNNFTMIFRDGNGNSSKLFSNSLTWNQNHTYRVEIEWGDTITATAFDHDGDGSKVVTDSTPEKTDLDAHNKNGGISFSDNGPVNSNSCAFDNLSVR